MKIINKTNVRTEDQNLHISVRTDTLYFNNAAVEKLQLHGKYIHFINDESTWSLFVNDDKDGFQVTFVGDKVGGRLHSNHLLRLLKKHYPTKRLTLLDTKREYKGFRIYEILKK